MSTLYQNLETFILYTKKGKVDLRYLLYGEKYQIEELLLEKLIKANNEIEGSIEVGTPESKNFIAQTLQDEIPAIFNNADYRAFFLEEKYDNLVTD